MIERDRAAQDCTVLYSTHSLEDAAVADRVIVVVGGMVRYDGKLAGVANVVVPGPDPVSVEDALRLDPVSTGMLRLWQGGGDA